MSADLGMWLRQQRQARSWNVPELARQLRKAARAAGDTLPAPGCLTTMIRRWERGGGVSERYLLHYCKTFQITPEQFGPRDPARRSAGLDRLALDQQPAGLPVFADVAYREKQEHGAGGSRIEREVLMAAHEGGEHADRAERRDIGDATLEQLRADVVRLSDELMTGEPLPLFMKMRQLRGRIFAVLDRQLWPRDQTDLYFLLGCLSCLMAVAADDLGSAPAAEELIRSGWAYAVAIDHRPLMGRLRMELANIAGRHQPRRSRDLADSGLLYLPDGPNAARLHLRFGRASARLGDADAARRAITSAIEAGQRDYSDDLLEIGGEFDVSVATQHYLAGAVLIDIPDAEAEAITELEHATSLYAAGPGPGETHGFGMRALAHIDLVTSLLRASQLDAAAVAVAPVLDLAPGQRITDLPLHFSRARTELARPGYQGSAQAKELDEQIEEFCRETILADAPG